MFIKKLIILIFCSIILISSHGNTEKKTIKEKEKIVLLAIAKDKDGTFFALIRDEIIYEGEIIFDASVKEISESYVLFEIKGKRVKVVPKEEIKDEELYLALKKRLKEAKIKPRNN